MNVTKEQLKKIEEKATTEARIVKFRIVGNEVRFWMPTWSFDKWETTSMEKFLVVFTEMNKLPFEFVGLDEEDNEHQCFTWKEVWVLKN